MLFIQCHVYVDIPMPTILKLAIQKIRFGCLVILRFSRLSFLFKNDYPWYI